MTDDEWKDVMREAFLKHNDPSNATVSVLERMDAFKLIMKFHNIFKRYMILLVIRREEFFHFIRHFTGRGGWN